jgi:hypothetical protein
MNCQKSELTERSFALAMCLTAAISVACEIERAPDGITCDKLRSLSVGMSVSEVHALLGSPVQETHQDGHVVFGEPATDLQWAWPGSVRLYLSFRQGRLLSASSWIRTTSRDLFDNESRPVLFTLKPDGSVREGQEFKRVYCP